MHVLIPIAEAAAIKQPVFASNRLPADIGHLNKIELAERINTQIAAHFLQGRTAMVVSADGEYYFNSARTTLYDNNVHLTFGVRRVTNTDYRGNRGCELSVATARLLLQQLAADSGSMAFTDEEREAITFSWQ